MDLGPGNIWSFEGVQWQLEAVVEIQYEVESTTADVRCSCCTNGKLEK